MDYNYNKNYRLFMSLYNNLSAYLCANSTLDT